MYRLKKIEKWQKFLGCMLDSLTVRKTAIRCGINKNTAFSWRHKFLNRLTPENETRMRGIIEMDETLFRYSEKGSRKLSRAAHNRGKDKTGRGRKKGDWVPVVIVKDRENYVFDNCLESEMANNLKTVLSHKLGADSVICTDSFRA